MTLAGVTEKRSSVCERQLVRYVCNVDGWSTGLHAAIECDDAPAIVEMRAHLVDEHPEGNWPYGRCGNCGKLTDHFRAVVGDLTIWGCPGCAPAPQLVDQAGA